MCEGRGGGGVGLRDIWDDIEVEVLMGRASRSGEESIAMAMVTMETHRQYAMMLYTCVLLPLGWDEWDGARHVGTAVHRQQNGQPGLEAEGGCDVSCMLWYRITAGISPWSHLYLQCLVAVHQLQQSGKGQL